MDTETVLKIIAMIDARIAECEDFKNCDALDDSQWRFVEGTQFGLQELSNHLQEYIESQVNQVENEMNRGE